MNIYARTASEALPILCTDVLAGQQSGSRNGAVRERLFYHVALTEPWRREILTPERKANVVAQIAETLWVLAGRNDVEWLSAYLPRAKDFSDDGQTWRAGYGPRIRAWEPDQDDREPVDQLAHVVNLLTANPDERRAVISLWDPFLDGHEAEGSKDVPCNNWLHFLVRDGKLHLHVAIRSNDLMWGWSGINAFEWSAVQELVASMIGAEVGELHFAISSLHLYQPYWAKAERIAEAPELVDAFVDDSPRANVRSIAELDRDLKTLFELEADLRAGRPHELIGAIVDPMLRSWAYVLAWHWTKDDEYLTPLEGTRLYHATQEMPVPAKPSAAEEFAEWAAKLHAEKHALYGDSWKKRGEFSIQANIARKIDRLGKAGAGDTELDTTTDLLVYLVKYEMWLAPWAENETDGQQHVEDVRNELLTLARNTKPLRSPESVEIALAVALDHLLRPGSTDKDEQVEAMAIDAFALALHRYTEHQKVIEARDVALRQAPTGLGHHAERNAKRFWNPEMNLEALNGGVL